MTLRVAVLGMGVWGTRLAEKVASLSEFELRGVFDEELSKTASWRERTRVFAGEDELLGSEVDAVLVAVTPEIQSSVALRVLAAGRALFVEKPCALRPDDAARLAEEARRRALVVGVGHLVRYGESAALLDAWIGELASEGALRRATFVRRGARPRKVHPLWVLGPHEASRLLSWFPGAHPTAVELALDGAFARLEDPRGVVIEWSVASSGPTERRLRVEGEKGFVEFDEATGRLIREFDFSGRGLLREERFIVEDRLASELRAFAKAVQERSRLVTDVEEGCRVTELLHRIETLGKRTSAMVPSSTPTSRTPSTSKAIEYSRS